MKKLIAHYLPQYHEFEENNNWWGKGFTEWTCVNNSFSTNRQHIIKKPHQDIGYYCLEDINVRRNQAIMAKKYGIYGFCYYHYWFGGKVLMEKTLEMMLLDNEPDLPFCFSWANEQWTRRMNGGDGSILQAKNYGGKEEWEMHLQYLLKFFKHKNYICINNCPVLLIYRISDIPNYQLRFNYWKNEIKKYGFDGLFIVMTIGNFKQDNFTSMILDVDSAVDFFPNFLWNHDLVDHKSGTYTYFDMNKVYDYIKKKPFIHPKQFASTMCGFDNFPRNVTHPNIFLNGTPTNFYQSLKDQVSRSKEDFIFINAWNEWGEGCALEPDTVYGYGYLESVKTVMRSTL